MPTFRDDDSYQRQIEEGELERTFILEQLRLKQAQELQVIAERGKVAETRLKMTQKADSKARVWVALFSIVPKTVLIISCFWLLLFHREIPKGWNEYISR